MTQIERLIRDVGRLHRRKSNIDWVDAGMTVAEVYNQGVDHALDLIVKYAEAQRSRRSKANIGKHHVQVR